jgi:hypothetical protein
MRTHKPIPDNQNSCMRAKGRLVNLVYERRDQLYTKYKRKVSVDQILLMLLEQVEVDTLEMMFAQLDSFLPTVK